MPKSRGPDVPQRRYERRATSRRVTLSPQTPDGEASLPATLADVSQSGIMLVLDSPLPAGRRFGLDLNRADGSSTRLLYPVVHCRPCGERMYRVGAELTSKHEPEFVAETPDALHPARPAV